MIRTSTNPNPARARTARLAVSVLGLLGVGAQAVAAQARDFDLRRWDLPIADGRTVRAEQGLLAVPLVRSDPASRTVHVEVHRFQAQDGAVAGVPPIFLLNGGPGWPGMGTSLSNPEYVSGLIDPLTRVADLVVIGQRGIGTSTPNTVCEAPPALPAGERMTAERRAESVLEGSRRCRQKWEAEGYDLRGFNVIEAAGDVDAVRRALGYERITLYGGSFGSHWSMAVMRYHPEIVARAVLWGLEGPDHTYDDPAGVLTALRGIAAAAERDEALAGHIPQGGLIAAFGALIERLDREPQRVTLSGSTIEVLITGDDLRDAALGYTRTTSSRSGMSTWPSDLLRLIHGDWNDFAVRVASRRRGVGPLPTASFFMLDCGSGITKERRARYSTDPAVAIVGDPGAFYAAACPAWNSDLGDAFRQNFETSIPTLLVHGTWDTSTPYVNAVELRPYFRRSHFVTVEGGSHGSLNDAMGAFPEFREAVSRFLATGELDGLPDRLTLPPLKFAVPPER